jgi:hypothetical protein
MKLLLQFLIMITLLLILFILFFLVNLFNLLLSLLLSGQVNPSKFIIKISHVKRLELRLFLPCISIPQHLLLSI